MCFGDLLTIQGITDNLEGKFGIAIHPFMDSEYVHLSEFLGPFLAIEN